MRGENPKTQSKFKAVLEPFAVQSWLWALLKDHSLNPKKLGFPTLESMCQYDERGPPETTRIVCENTKCPSSGTMER